MSIEAPDSKTIVLFRSFGLWLEKYTFGVSLTSQNKVSEWRVVCVCVKMICICQCIGLWRHFRIRLSLSRSGFFSNIQHFCHLWRRIHIHTKRHSRAVCVCLCVVFRCFLHSFTYTPAHTCPKNSSVSSDWDWVIWVHTKRMDDKKKWNKIGNTVGAQKRQMSFF